MPLPWQTRTHTQFIATQKEPLNRLILHLTQAWNAEGVYCEGCLFKRFASDYG
jgi:hypothetical protein